MSAKPHTPPPVPISDLPNVYAATLDDLATRATATKTLVNTATAEYTVYKDEMESITAQLGHKSITAPTWTFTLSKGRESLDKGKLLTLTCEHVCECGRVSVKPALTAAKLKLATVTGDPSWRLVPKNAKGDTTPTTEVDDSEQSEQA